MKFYYRTVDVTGLPLWFLDSFMGEFVLKCRGEKCFLIAKERDWK